MIFSDGGARGNPGPAAFAFIIQSGIGEVVASSSGYSGNCTNNQAEYLALLAALEAAAKLKTETVTCHLDSELVVKQLNGEYRVKNKELKLLWQKVKGFTKQFKEVQFISVPRTHRTIQAADRLVNLILDVEFK
ncbi:MAG TPA: ribonuclease HI family protein [Candidatus Bathyarchaeia archaeon]|nr:ribonuclease HI family protein [Candidatus Bathyarchaeia archaeon]